VSLFVGPFAIICVESGEESEHLWIGAHFQQVVSCLPWKQWHGSAVPHIPDSGQPNKKMRVSKLAFWKFVEVDDQARDSLALRKQKRNVFSLGDENGTCCVFAPEFCGT